MSFVDFSIQLTVEETISNCSRPFLNTIVTPQTDGTFKTEVYRKPTHTHLCWQWDSHHYLASKYNVINTLTERAKAVCSTSLLLKTELQNLVEVLIGCKYPKRQ